MHGDNNERAYIHGGVTWIDYEVCCDLVLLLILNCFFCSLQMRAVYNEIEELEHPAYRILIRTL